MDKLTEWREARAAFLALPAGSPETRIALDRLAKAEDALYQAPNAKQSFQQRVMDWSIACFGIEIAHDHMERNHRFLEEALELANACGCTASEAHQLVDYVFRKTDDDKVQEAGGVMVTLALLLEVHRIQMEAAGEQELARIWTKVDAIRTKQAAKPKHSPLPQESDRA